MYGSEVWSVSPSLLLGDLTLLTHGLSVKSFGSRTQDTSSTLLSGRLPAVIQFPRYPRDGSASSGMHVVCADPEQDHRRVIGASLRPPSLVDALVPAG